MGPFFSNSTFQSKITEEADIVVGICYMVFGKYDNDIVFGGDCLSVFDENEATLKVKFVSDKDELQCFHERRKDHTVTSLKSCSLCSVLRTKTFINTIGRFINIIGR